jgi:predicted HTH transcriptional regulator
MPLTIEQRDVVVSELKKIGASLNLSDDQRQKLQAFMIEAREKVQEYKQQNPDATQQDLVKKVMDNRAALRQRLVNFLTPDQLTKWDSEVANAKEFLGQKLAA